MLGSDELPGAMHMPSSRWLHLSHLEGPVIPSWEAGLDSTLPKFPHFSLVWVAWGKAERKAELCQVSVSFLPLTNPAWEPGTLKPPSKIPWRDTDQNSCVPTAIATITEPSSLNRRHFTSIVIFNLIINYPGKWYSCSPRLIHVETEALPNVWKPSQAGVLQTEQASVK